MIGRRGLWLVLTVFLAACGDPHGEGCSDVEGLVCNSALIKARTGGTLYLSTPNGSGSLEFPPGALSHDTVVSAYAPAIATDGTTFLEFHPDGLSFNATARLTLPTPAFSNPQEPPLMQWYQHSELNEEIDAGSELSYWQPIENAEWNEQAGTVSGDLEHFSSTFFFWGIAKYAYLVVDLPGKYLRPGDMVTVMTSPQNTAKNNWMPGHVALIRSVDATGATVIESTINGGADQTQNGVQTNPLTRFKTEVRHVFMGASRPPGSALTDAERRTIVEFADDKLFQIYNQWGAPSVGELIGWSCSGLVEASLDEADRGVRGLFDAFPSPIELYEDTRLVTEIDVRTEEEIKIPVYPVAIAAGAARWGLSSNAWYDEGAAAHPGIMITATDLPPNSTFAVDPNHRYGAHTLTWTPTIENAGDVYTVRFQMVGTQTLNNGVVIPYSVARTLTINVTGASIEFDVTPVPMGSPGTYYTEFKELPPNAVIDKAGGLIDQATGVFPTSPVFPNQEIDEFSVGPIIGVPNHYGCDTHLTRTDNPQNPAPPGMKQWTCWFDWYYDRYDGTN